jgi:predicted MPP superfamily phosphohydrolase
LAGFWYAAFLLICQLAYRIRPTGLVPKLMNGHVVTDFALAYPFWILAIVAGQIIPYLLLVDLASLTARHAGYADPDVLRSLQARLTFGLTVGVLAFVVAKAYLDTRTIRVRSEVVVLEKLSDALDGFRFAHISDVQADPRTDSTLLREYTSKVNQLEADVVIFAGDLVTRGTDHVEEGVACLASIRAAYGVCACLGDHDIWSAPKMITAGLRSAGIKLVEDGYETIHVGDASVGVSVVTNAYSSRPVVGAGELRPEGDVSIILTHQPSAEFVEQVSKSGPTLMLSGHTHGGQVGLNWFGYHLNASSFETPYVSGIYRLGGLILSVTNGLGLTLAPFRYLAPAEITLLTLRSA